MGGLRDSQWLLVAVHGETWVKKKSQKVGIFIFRSQTSAYGCGEGSY